MKDAEIIAIACKTLDHVSFFGEGRILSATDDELLVFAREIVNKTILEVVAAIQAPAEATEKIYVADAANRAIALMH